jgi:hypothetical protein
MGYIPGPVDLAMNVSIQPPRIWFQFGDGPMKIQFMDNRNIPDDRKWIEPQLLLLYSDTLLPVTCTSTDPTKAGACTTFRMIDSEIIGNTLNYQLKIHEITKNHQSRPFCLCLRMGGEQSFISGEFDVKTKKTNPKALRNHRKTATDFKRQTKHVLSMLEWRLSGYERTVDDVVDFGQPIHSCPLCRERRESGHKTTCAIHVLMHR